MVTVNICGREYPLCYNVAAQHTIAARFGGIEHLENAFDVGIADVCDNTAYMIAALMDGAAKRLNAENLAFGLDHPVEKALTYEQLSAILSPVDLMEMVGTVQQAIAEGNNRTVETKETKKTGATQSG